MGFFKNVGIDIDFPINPLKVVTENIVKFAGGRTDSDLDYLHGIRVKNTNYIEESCSAKHQMQSGGVVIEFGGMMTYIDFTKKDKNGTYPSKKLPTLDIITLYYDSNLRGWFYHVSNEVDRRSANDKSTEVAVQLMHPCSPRYIVNMIVTRVRDQKVLGVRHMDANIFQDSFKTDLELNSHLRTPNDYFAASLIELNCDETCPTIPINHGLL